MGKMKIGIITIVKVNNYGAELQAFALQKKLELAGFQSEIIDYLYYKNWRFKDTKASRPFVALGTKGKVRTRGSAKCIAPCPGFMRRNGIMMSL